VYPRFKYKILKIIHMIKSEVGSFAKSDQRFACFTKTVPYLLMLQRPKRPALSLPEFPKLCARTRRHSWWYVTIFYAVYFF